jgi:hypothetical protein
MRRIEEEHMERAEEMSQTEYVLNRSRMSWAGVSTVASARKDGRLEQIMNNDAAFDS